jgi:hypothetical protein
VRLAGPVINATNQRRIRERRRLKAAAIVLLLLIVVAGVADHYLTIATDSENATAHHQLHDDNRE